MDKRVTAILLKATDLRENDKQVRLFCAEEGLITATMRGVKKATAKLKFAAQPFAFCEYELNEKNGNYTVTGATAIEDTFAVAGDIERFAVANLVAEAVEKSAQSVDSAPLFIVMLKALKAVLYSSAPLMLIAAKSLQKILSMTGFVTVPERRESYPDTPKGLLERIAYMTLDGLEEVEAPPARIRNAFIITVKEAERIFESELKSAKFLMEISR